MRRGALFLALACVLGPAARGGEPASAKEARALSLEEAVRLALKRSESVLAARAAARGTEGSIAAACAGLFPTLTAQAGYTRSYLEPSAAFDLGGLAGGIPGLDADEQSDSYLATLELRQPLYSGGRLAGAIAVAREARALAGEDVRLSELRLVRDIRGAYDRVLLAREFAAVAAETHALARERLEIVEARVAAGAAREFERLRARVQVSNRETERVMAENAHALAAAGLLRALSLPQDTRLALTSALDEGKAAAAPGLEEALARAKRRRPELARLDRLIAMQRVQASLVRADLRPTVSATASLGGLASDDPFEDDEWADTWSLGLLVTWPIFDGGRARGRSVEERAMLDRLLLERRALGHGIALEVRRALVALENARRSIRSQRENEARAREGLRLAGVALKNGAAREIDVSDARTELAVARRLHAQALFDERAARADLAFATGEPRPDSKGEDP